MDTLIPFSPEALDTMVQGAVDKFFETMLPGCMLSYQESWMVKPTNGEGEGRDAPVTSDAVVVSMVGFIGSLNGVLYLYMSDSLARDVTCNFLGMEPDELDEEPDSTVNDALGEMANMIAGTFKNGLCDSGFNCRLTIPSILRGSQFSVETTSEVLRRVSTFKAMGEELTCDLLMKPADK